jgi:hypothetical protein
VRPNSLKRVNALAGIELHTDNSGYDLLQNPFNYFFACLTQLNGMPKYQLTHELQAGIKLGRWLHKGLVLYVSYYYGNNVFNIFYMERISRAGLGFTVDFP